MAEEPKNKGGRPRKDEQLSDPETMMRTAVQENLRVLHKIRTKVEKLVDRVSRTVDKLDDESDNGASLEKQQTAMKALSDTLKTLSDSTANAVKGLAALEKIKPSGDESKDQAILDKLLSGIDEKESNDDE